MKKASQTAAFALFAAYLCTAFAGCASTDDSGRSSVISGAVDEKSFHRNVAKSLPRAAILFRLLNLLPINLLKVRQVLETLTTSASAERRGRSPFPSVKEHWCCVTGTQQICPHISQIVKSHLVYRKNAEKYAPVNSY